MTVLPINKVVELINESKIFCGDQKLICIDGPAGSGKTTLAKNLQNYFDQAFVIHMDEIYEGWEDSLNDGLAEKINNWILSAMKNNEKISYKKYDWYEKKRLEEVNIQKYKFIILEGVGSASIKVRENSALNIWIEANPEILLNRVLNRDGESIRDHMLKWQIMEKEYFLKQDIKNHCDIWIDGNFDQEIDSASQIILLNR